MPIQEQSFLNRLAASGEDTTNCVKKLFEVKHIFNAKKAELERDKNEGVDFDFDYEKELNVPNQFKVRHNHPDIPIVIAQPFWGYGHDKTKMGRDLVGLLKKKTKYHYVGIVKNNVVQSVFYAKSSVVAKEATAALKAWYDAETDTIAGRYGKKWFTPEMVEKWILKVRDKNIFDFPNGIQIWWKKNKNEKFPKLNMYIPMDLVKGTIIYQLPTAKSVGL